MYRAFLVNGEIVFSEHGEKPLHGTFESEEEGRLFLSTLNEFEIQRWINGEYIFLQNERARFVRGNPVGAGR